MPPPPPAASFALTLLAWAETLDRPMPWRGERDPYRVWLSEVILQQTRVATGADYYRRFLEAFPTVADLAAAPEREVLALWQGLGYYRRARNLHRAAREVVDERGGAFPTTYDDILALPGIGPYTAAAVASFAFGEPVAVVDGNVYRVLARLFGLDDPIDRPAGQRRFRALADELLPPAAPAAYNQAIMDFGATVCTPKSPSCASCPFRERCVALASGRVGELPAKTGATRRRARYLDYVHLVDARRRMLLRERGAGDIWEGLYDLPAVESAADFASRRVVEAGLPLLALADARAGGVSPPVKHVLSHQNLYARFWRYELEGVGEVPRAGVGGEAWAWVRPEDLVGYGLPRLLTRYLETPRLF